MNNSQQMQGLAVAGSLFAELMAMAAANHEREAHDYAYAYDEEAFCNVAQRFGELAKYARLAGCSLTAMAAEVALAKAKGEYSTPAES